MQFLEITLLVNTLETSGNPVRSLVKNLSEVVHSYGYTHQMVVETKPQ
jgi:hypothetical protein